MLTETKMPEYLDEVQLDSELQKQLDETNFEDKLIDAQDTENFEGQAEIFYNAVLNIRRYDDIVWDDIGETITFDCPVEFDFERQKDRQALDDILLSVKAESQITGVEMPELKEIQIARDQIEESYSNLYMIDDLAEFFDKWGSATEDMNEEQVKNKDYSRFIDYKCYIHSPQLFLTPHLEGQYFDEVYPIEKKYN